MCAGICRASAFFADVFVDMMHTCCALSCESAHEIARSWQGTHVNGHVIYDALSMQVDDFILDYVI